MLFNIMLQMELSHGMQITDGIVCGRISLIWNWIRDDIEIDCEESWNVDHKAISDG